MIDLKKSSSVPLLNFNSLSFDSLSFDFLKTFCKSKMLFFTFRILFFFGLFKSLFYIFDISHDLLSSVLKKKFFIFEKKFYYIFQKSVKSTIFQLI